MDTTTWVVVIVLVALVLLGVVLWLAMMRRRSEQLREVYGPEYDRTVEESEDRRAAESELVERQKRVEEFDIRPLDPAERTRFASRWIAVQSRFVDDPKSALGEADELVTEVMSERGYPMDEFEQRAADVSVDHPEVVEHYHAAHHVYLANDRGEASTEDLRQGVVHYRALFEELLETREEATEEVQ